MSGQGEFSLYSTDSEEQVSSAYRGLNRCASLLATLLSPENNAEAVSSVKQSKEKPNAKVSLPRQSVAGPNTKCSSTTTVKVDGYHSKDPVQSAEKKTKPPRHQENRHSKTVSKKILPHRSKPRNRKGLVQLLNKPKEESKGNSKTVQDKTKRLSHLVATTTTHTPATTAGNVSNSHFSTTNIAVTSTGTNTQPRMSSSTKSTPVSCNVPEMKSHSTNLSSSLPPYHPVGSGLMHQHLPYYLPTYQPHPPIPLAYPYPYHPYRYSSVPVYVADVTRRYNEMYGPHNGINGVHSGQQYQQCFNGVSQVCDTGIQSLSQVSSSIRDTAVHVDDTGGGDVPVVEGKTGDADKEKESLVANAKRLVVVRELVDTLKKKLEGCEVDGVSGVVEELDRMVSSGVSEKTGLLLHANTPWALQSPTSAADWLSRLQKKDKEKKELEKKLQESYQESSKLTVQLQENADTVECLRKQVDVLKTAQLVSGEELETAKSKINELTQLKNKTTRQLKECLDGVNGKNEEISQVKEQLKATKNRLEEVEEEYQMLKLSLTRREEELTASLDKNLGYQQCLASIVANLVASRIPGGVAYKVDEPLMKRLQVLLKDGNVDGFLRASDTTNQSLELTADSQDLTGVTELTLSPPARTSSVCNGPRSFIEAYRTKATHNHSCSMVSSNSSGELPQEAYSLGGCESSSDTFSKIMADKSNQTSLTAASEVEFRNNLAILDADIAKLQLQFQIAKSSNS